MWTVADFKSLTLKDQLTPAEGALIAACEAGEPCFLGDGRRPDVCTPERSIRAALLRVLVLGSTSDCGLADAGLQVSGAFIEGKLDLSFSVARGATGLQNCYFESPPCLTAAEFKMLSFTGSYLPGLSAQGIVVTGSLLFRSVESIGVIDLTGANIGGALACDEAVFVGKDGYSLKAQGVSVGQNLFLRRIKTIGTVSINGATVKGQLSFFRAALDCVGGIALNADCLKVGESLFWREVIVVSGDVIFTSARIGELTDDSFSWTMNSSGFSLNGFVYDRIAINSSIDSQSRLEWLKSGSIRNGNFYPQPYTQLAKVLRSMGHDRDARLVLVEQARLLGIEAQKAVRLKPDGKAWLRMENPWVELKSAGLWLFDTATHRIAGYGHRPIFALWWLVGLLVAATILVSATWNEGSFAPNSDVIITSPAWTNVVAQDCVPENTPGCLKNPADEWSSQNAPGMDWDSFNAIAYAADLVIPILDLGQTDAWAPSKDRGTVGWWMWCLRWPLAAAGWLVTALGVAAITGIMQRNQPGA